MPRTTLRAPSPPLLSSFLKLPLSDHRVQFITPGWEEFTTADLELSPTVFMAKFEKVCFLIYLHVLDSETFRTRPSIVIIRVTDVRARASHARGLTVEPMS